MLLAGPAGDQMTKRTKNGRTMTNADIEAMAAEAERGHDLTGWVLAPIKPGEENGIDEDLLRDFHGQGRREAWEAFAQGEALPDPVKARRARPDETPPKEP
jgi:hypothetical protein